MFPLRRPTAKERAEPMVCGLARYPGFTRSGAGRDHLGSGGRDLSRSEVYLEDLELLILLHRYNVQQPFTAILHSGEFSFDSEIGFFPGAV